MESKKENKQILFLIVAGIVAVVAITFLLPALFEEESQGTCTVTQYYSDNYYVGEEGRHYVDPGMDCLIIFYTLENHSAEDGIEIRDNEAWGSNFQVVADGVVYDAPYTSDDHPKKTSASSVRIGGSVDSVVIFVIPEDAEEFVLEWIGEDNVDVVFAC